ncbi:hypothetical protein EPUS_07115 [Endocarpon pusillum Z07020]|uniref:Cytochrome P450-DIT2 n=1 Tax=Endocarpon pusillum (strain Z07020 / HMAS-L-300199) TaxID=1263415 RepID=U1GM85_ENDPU|nr:uncharacterized protein EPUS_07115 [Endocarpon pusillum Z07020]ERF73021.1 hypothetical protein EPUS_07115 [Endocarpon pusillum Z07020]
MAILTYFGGVVGALAILLYRLLRIPSNLPKNIPAVPIYISLLGLWSDMGQDEIYDRWLRQPLEKYGAVKIWFAGRWNLLVTRPEYLSDMLKHEDVFAKAGSQKKIPWSVISSLVGDNIINSHGDDWKLYTSVMKPGLQKTNFDSKPILDKSRRFVDILLNTQKDIGANNGFLVNPIIQRFAIAAMGESFLDIDFECLERPNARIEVLQSIIKRTIFKPLYFNFPVLDMYPYIFRSRRRAFAIMKEFEDLLYDLVRNRPRKLLRKEPVKPEDELVVHMMERALDEGIINEQQFRANLKIVFLTAHENTQQLLNSMFWQLGSDQTIQDKLRAEVLATGVTNPTSETLNKLPYLTSLICELLRVYPPVSQLINRVSLEPYVLGGEINIPKGTWVGWNAPGVQSSEAAWGKTARQFIPERWGDKPEEIMAKARRETVKGRYIAFNAYNRKCLGQGYALLEMKMVLFELVRRVKWTVDPQYRLKLTSGGILAPLGCKIRFEELDSSRLNADSVT